MEYVDVTINGMKIQVLSGITVMKAAEQAGINIPSLCFLKNVAEGGNCRMCMVEIGPDKALYPACTTIVKDGMDITTESRRLFGVRKMNLELICSNHRMDCTYCQRFPYCELRDLCSRYGIDENRYRYSREEEIDSSAGHLVRDTSKCILCNRCVKACENQGIFAIGVSGRGMNSKITPGAMSLHLNETACIGCGQCIAACPTGALSDKDCTGEIYKALTQHKCYTAVFITQEALEQLAVCMLDEPGRLAKQKTAAMLKNIGFMYTGAVDCMNGSMLASPFTGTVCPPIINYCRQYYPELVIDDYHPLEKAVQAFKANKTSMSKRIFTVGVTTCTAMKKEPLRGFDQIITPRELARMIYRFCVSHFTALEVWNHLKPAEFDLDVNENVSVEGISGEDNNVITGFKEVVKTLENYAASNKEMDPCVLYACPAGCKNGGGQARNRRVLECKGGDLSWN